MAYAPVLFIGKLFGINEKALKEKNYTFLNDEILKSFEDSLMKGDTKELDKYILNYKSGMCVTDTVKLDEYFL